MKAESRTFSYDSQASVKVGSVQLVLEQDEVLIQVVDECVNGPASVSHKAAAFHKELLDDWRYIFTNHVQNLKAQ
jgi:hypothetical protein